MQAHPQVRLQAQAAPMVSPAAARTRLRFKVFRLLDDARVGLSLCLQQGLSEPALLATARQVLHAAQLDADAALAFALVGPPTSYSVRHAVDCAVLAEALARQFAWDEPRRLVAVAAALTMNVAMADLQDELFHQPGPLDAAQRARVAAHPAKGARLLREAGVRDATWINALEQHHEAFDGSG